MARRCEAQSLDSEVEEDLARLKIVKAQLAELEKSRKQILNDAKKLSKENLAGNNSDVSHRLQDQLRAEGEETVRLKDEQGRLEERIRETRLRMEELKKSPATNDATNHATNHATNQGHNTNTSSSNLSTNKNNQHSSSQYGQSRQAI